MEVVRSIGQQDLGEEVEVVQSPNFSEAILRLMVAQDLSPAEKIEITFLPLRNVRG